MEGVTALLTHPWRRRRATSLLLLLLRLASSLGGIVLGTRVFRTQGGTQLVQPGHHGGADDVPPQTCGAAAVSFARQDLTRRHQGCEKEEGPKITAESATCRFRASLLVDHNVVVGGSYWQIPIKKHRVRFRVQGLTQELKTRCRCWVEMISKPFGRTPCRITPTHIANGCYQMRQRLVSLKCGDVGIALTRPPFDAKTAPNTKPSGMSSYGTGASDGCRGCP